MFYVFLFIFWITPLSYLHILLSVFRPHHMGLHLLNGKGVAERRLSVMTHQDKATVFPRYSCHGKQVNKPGVYMHQRAHFTAEAILYQQPWILRCSVLSRLFRCHSSGNLVDFSISSFSGGHWLLLRDVVLLLNPYLVIFYTILV